MKRLTIIFAMLLSLCSYSQTVNFSLDVSVGAVSGLDRIISGTIKVSESPYEIYKDTYSYQRNVRPAVQWGAGAFFRNVDDRPVAEVSVGLSKGIDNFNPVFLYTRASVAALNINQFTFMPYTGVAHWISNIEQGEKGWNMTGGMQVLYWVEGDLIGRQSLFSIIDYTHRHTTVTFGLKSHFR